MYESGRITATEYRAKCADLDEQRLNLSTKRPKPVLVRQRTMLATLVDDWDEMTAEERRRVIDVVFAEVHASSRGIARLSRDRTGNPTWRPFYARLSRWTGGVLSGRRDSMSPMLKQPDWSATSADGSG
jgi:hypothetical protein